MHYSRFVKEVIREWLVFEYGCLGHDSLQFNKRILTIICSTGGRVLEKMLSLRYVTMCDFRRRGCLVVMIPEGVPLNLDLLRTLIEESVHSVLCGSKIHEYNRSKWNGHEESIDCYLLSDALCGVGTEAYRRLASYMRTRTKTKSNRNIDHHGNASAWLG